MQRRLAETHFLSKIAICEPGSSPRTPVLVCTFGVGLFLATKKLRKRRGACGETLGHAAGSRLDQASKDAKVTWHFFVLGAVETAVVDEFEPTRLIAFTWSDGIEVRLEFSEQCPGDLAGTRSRESGLGDAGFRFQNRLEPLHFLAHVFCQPGS